MRIGFLENILVTHCREHVIQWYQSKIFIFSQVMAKNGIQAHIWAYNFAKVMAIFGPIELQLFGSLRDYYPSITDYESKL